MIERKAKPKWLKSTMLSSGKTCFKIKRELEKRDLNTICQNARCPNISECWNNYNATLLIMGNICTRNCSFCSVIKGTPKPLNYNETERILEMIDILKSKYIVITSVTRDDLIDGGSSYFAYVIRKITNNKPELRVELLIPDFKGNSDHLDNVLEAEPDVLNHNIETVKRLYPKVNRNPKNYYISLEVLKYSKKKDFITKSGIMVGLGESKKEIEELFQDLRENGVDLLTIGQYLQPTIKNVSTEKFYTPYEFKTLKNIALSYGFKIVESGPLVRSSFNAYKMYYNYTKFISKTKKKNEKYIKVCNEISYI